MIVFLCSDGWCRAPHYACIIRMFFFPQKHYWAFIHSRLHLSFYNPVPRYHKKLLRLFTVNYCFDCPEEFFILSKLLTSLFICFSKSLVNRLKKIHIQLRSLGNFPSLWKHIVHLCLYTLLLQLLCVFYWNHPVGNHTIIQQSCTPYSRSIDRHYRNKTSSSPSFRTLRTSYICFVLCL